MNSLHLKHCVQSYNVFDFLRDVVSRVWVPDYSHGHSEAGTDDRAFSKRRKAAAEDCNDSDEEAKRGKMRELSHSGSTSRGRGRGRGAQTVEREAHHQEAEPEPCTTVQYVSQHNTDTNMTIHECSEWKEDIDLNANMNDNDDKNASAAANASLSEPATEIKHEEFPGWSLSDVDKMAIDTMQLVHLVGYWMRNEEDYDEEG
ncbi:unnamed protein product [Lupinus luteus]|uniref:Uncharacterized protein n=1 Tax=Lupinus luteus TaxID=3873 RepID=A0AAV1Y4L8_LUPLU